MAKRKRGSLFNVGEHEVVSWRDSGNKGAAGHRTWAQAYADVVDASLALGSGVFAGNETGCAPAV